jgi:hypothetical protein
MALYSNIPVYLRWLYWCSPMSYAVSATLKNEFENVPGGPEYLEMFGAPIQDKWECFYYVLAWCVGTRVACFFALKYLQQERR